MKQPSGCGLSLRVRVCQSGRGVAPTGVRHTRPARTPAPFSVGRRQPLLLHQLRDALLLLRHQVAPAQHLLRVLGAYPSEVTRPRRHLSREVLGRQLDAIRLERRQVVGADDEDLADGDRVQEALEHVVDHGERRRRVDHHNLVDRLGVEGAEVLVHQPHQVDELLVGVAEAEALEVEEGDVLVRAPPLRAGQVLRGDVLAQGLLVEDLRHQEGVLRRRRREQHLRPHVAKLLDDDRVAHRVVPHDAAVPHRLKLLPLGRRVGRVDARDCIDAELGPPLERGVEVGEAGLLVISPVRKAAREADEEVALDLLENLVVVDPAAHPAQHANLELADRRRLVERRDASRRLLRQRLHGRPSAAAQHQHLVPGGRRRRRRALLLLLVVW
mmetsp:Transcript_2411/g.7243  ORF Transcript_2411/g.7243 Transcript_2411/m.7243 type:complete len:385 (+) Transcript_2411:309-1463(+)